MLDLIVISILLVLAATTWAVRYLLARVWPAHNIDGPPSASFLTGEHVSIPILTLIYPQFCAGNLLQIIAPDTGRDFQLHIANLYGGVVKIKGLLGVCLAVIFCSSRQASRSLYFRDILSLSVTQRPCITSLLKTKMCLKSGVLSLRA